MHGPLPRTCLAIFNDILFVKHSDMLISISVINDSAMPTADGQLAPLSISHYFKRIGDQAGRADIGRRLGW